MNKVSELAFLAFVLAIVSPLLAAPVHSEEESCGIVHKQRREPIAQRFWPLAEYGGRAFIDMRTCLVWRLDVQNETLTLWDAMSRCAELGGGGVGPYEPEMGWQLPTVAELTSVDGKEWEEQRDEFEQNRVPPLIRESTDYWTSTIWPGGLGVGVVQFSERGTYVRLSAGEKAAVWCVRGIPARGLE